METSNIVPGFLVSVLTAVMLSATQLICCRPLLRFMRSWLSSCKAPCGQVAPAGVGPTIEMPCAAKSVERCCTIVSADFNEVSLGYSLLAGHL